MLSSKPSLHLDRIGNPQEYPGTTTGTGGWLAADPHTRNATPPRAIGRSAGLRWAPHWGVRPCLLLLVSVFALGFCLDAGGCAGGPPPISKDVVEAPDGAASMTVWGDWDDLNASIGSGFTVAESAVLDTTSSDDRRTWSVITIDNYAGLVTATRDTTAARDDRGCERITVTAKLDGDKGNSRAAMIVSGAAARLKQLAGVEWAPRR